MNKPNNASRKKDQSYEVHEAIKPVPECPRCMLGKSCKDGCEFYDHGSCNGVIHPTYPPQKAKCEFDVKYDSGWGSGIATVVGDQEKFVDNEPKLSYTKVQESIISAVLNLAETMTRRSECLKPIQQQITSDQMLHMIMTLRDLCNAYIDENAYMNSYASR